MGQRGKQDRGSDDGMIHNTKVNRIIDVALAALDGSNAHDELRHLDSTTTTTNVGKKDGDEEDEEDDVNNVKKLLLATENSNTLNNVKVDCDIGGGGLPRFLRLKYSYVSILPLFMSGFSKIKLIPPKHP